MNTHCRICGICHPVKLIKQHFRNILEYMHTSSLTLEGQSIHVCYRCTKKLKPIHKRQYGRRNDGRPPLKIINIVPWDYSDNCPLTTNDYIPMDLNMVDLTVVIPKLRRSTRKSKTNLLLEKRDDLEQAIRSQNSEGLQIKDFGAKGRGIVATHFFSKGDFVIEYIGTLMDSKTGRAKEENYSHDPSIGCYSFYFTHGGRQWCIDATEESPYMGRLVNHSHKHPNMVAKSVEVDSLPHLVFLAKRDIEEKEEIVYDYGDRSKEAIANNSWLAL